MEDVFLKVNGKDEKVFLQTYNHGIKAVSEIGLDWASLVRIHNYYKSTVVYGLELAAQEMFLKLKAINGAHTVKYRIKDPEHLIDKIIRKKIDEEKVITEENFLEEIDDLIGFRILHLFKTDWEPIFKTIKSMYKAKETPVAYHRDGDDPFFIQKCRELGLDPKVKTAGYRSIHYIALFPSSTGDQFKCEIQIRTLFEEAWSEIDHLVRYPNNTDNELLNSYLLMFNKLAGYADDMGTFLMAMKSNMTEQKIERNKLEKKIEKLREEISSLELTNSRQKARLDKLMKELDKGVSSGWTDFSAFQYPSTLDYISQIQAPSGSTILGSIPSLSDYLGALRLSAKNSLDSSQNTIEARVKAKELSDMFSSLSLSSTVPIDESKKLNGSKDKKK